MTINRKNIPALVLAMLPALALAAGDHAAPGGQHGNMPAAAEHDSAGTAGDAAKVTRTIPVEMHDNMRFTPDNITVKAGETVRFFVVNKGKVRHEMMIGSMAELNEHAEMMKKVPDMVHKEPNQISLAPGQRGAVVWQFTDAGAVNFACLQPGHKEAGMVGVVQVQ